MVDVGLGESNDEGFHILLNKVELIFGVFFRIIVLYELFLGFGTPRVLMVNEVENENAEGKGISFE